MKKEEVKEFLDQFDLDIRKNGYNRCVDQKCTYDVTCFVADCIINFVEDDREKVFTASEIWKSEYSCQYVMELFNKSNPLLKSSKSEYDKFFPHPIKMFVYANILERAGKRTIVGKNERFWPTLYKVRNYEVLEFIASRERNAYEFLCMYFEKLMRDSGLEPSAQNFYTNQDQTSLDKFKDDFEKLIKENSSVRKDLECRRIYAKVINPICCKLGLRGAAFGDVTDNPIQFSNLVYNAENRRDKGVNKPKNIARRDFEIPEEITDVHTIYLIEKAKKRVRKYNEKNNGSQPETYPAFVDQYSIPNIDKSSEEYESLATTVEIHHIFPAHPYETIAHYLENLIALSNNQHRAKAHPNGKYKEIDPDYQYYLLLCKAARIKSNLSMPNVKDHFYNFDDYKYVLNTGFGTDKFENVADMDFDTIIQLIDEFCTE